MFDDKARLECFDRAVKAVIDGPAISATPQNKNAGAPISPPQKTASEPAAKILDPRDVRNTPGKWQGRQIQFNNVQVYWVHDDDVRILLPGAGGMTLFAINVVGPQDAIDFYKRECETSKEARSAKCKASVKFSFFEHEEDKPDGFSSRVVLVTKDLTLLRVAKEVRR